MSPNWDLCTAAEDQQPTWPHSNGFHFRPIAPVGFGATSRDLSFTRTLCWELNQMWILLSIIQIVGLSINPNLCPRAVYLFLWLFFRCANSEPINISPSLIWIYTAIMFRETKILQGCLSLRWIALKICSPPFIAFYIYCRGLTSVNWIRFHPSVVT